MRFIGVGGGSPTHHISIKMVWAECVCGGGSVSVSMCVTYKICCPQHAIVQCYLNTYIFKCVCTHAHAHTTHTQQQLWWWLLEKLNGNTNTIFRLKSFCFIDISAFSLHCNTKPKTVVDTDNKQRNTAIQFQLHSAIYFRNEWMDTTPTVWASSQNKQ